ncbi:glycogenin glucosyltransferase [Thelotrema lepadinum]|nr:glycogenin glucosyltransferase [Thelotrema lepadinum]
MAAASQHAYCTLLMTDSYLPGAMILAHSLRDNGTHKQLVALVTLDSISSPAVEELKTVYDQVIPVDRVVNKSPANLYLMDRADLAASFTKIALWRLTQFSRIVYLDADIVALRAPDELFDLPSKFAASPDVGWPDCFNSGVLALTPNMQDYYGLQALARNSVSFDGADQGLLNTYFSGRNWQRLSFTYNCTPSGNYQYAPAYRHYGSTIHMIHFIGRDKPWLVGRNAEGSSGVYGELLARWWAVYDAHYRIPTTAYISGQAISRPRIVQQHVFGEAQTADFGFSSASPHSASSTIKAPVSMSESLFEKSDLVEQINQGEITPTPTAEQRRFSTPYIEWDPTRQPPPVQSRPEASNFPTQQYVMSEDTGLFKPPKSYPEPPKDLHYEVPRERAPPTSRPKPIFPWEAYQAPATRVFADEEPSTFESKPLMEAGTELPLLQTDVETSEGTADTTPVTPTIHVSEHRPFSSYQRTNTWDEIPEIQKYVERFSLSRYGAKHSTGRHTPSSSMGSVISPSEGEETTGRRPSLRLTDFPTEVERPSLPVTPVARGRRSTFWGEERDDQGELPAAKGVPAQQDWDPEKKLEELQRRQSETLMSGLMTTTYIPERELPESAKPSVQLRAMQQRGGQEMSGVSAESSSVARQSQPVFQGVNFTAQETATTDEPVLSPTGV